MAAMHVAYHWFMKTDNMNSIGAGRSAFTVPLEGVTLDTLKAWEEDLVDFLSRKEGVSPKYITVTIITWKLVGESKG